MDFFFFKSVKSSILNTIKKEKGNHRLSESILEKPTCKEGLDCFGSIAYD